MELTVGDAGNVRGRGGTGRETIDSFVVTLMGLGLCDPGIEMSARKVVGALVRIESAMVRNGK